MRLAIQIVGVGDRRKGVSQKTGRAYDFTPVAFTYEHMRMTGVGAATVNISQDCCPADYSPAVGDVVEAVIREDYKTGRMYVDAIL